jgi:hypothetical protein
MSNQIPGVPEGWVLVRIGHPVIGVDCVIDYNGDIVVFRGNPNVNSGANWPIIRKIEKPARYRPFANSEEFKPHRDRWWMLKDLPPELIGPRGSFIEPPEAYAEKGFAGCDWEGAFELRVFDDGTPFGVKIDE